MSYHKHHKSSYDNYSKLKPFEKSFYYPSKNKMSTTDISNYRKEHQIKISGKAPTSLVINFSDIKLPNYVIDEIENQNFNIPTPAQAQTWPIALLGCNLVCVAPTGSGKTLSYLIPAIIHVNHQKMVKPGEGPIAIILVPTRELAQQIGKVATNFCRTTDVRCMSIFGGVPKYEQIPLLRDGIELLVSTPGRLIDLIQNKIVRMDRVTFCVLDESDELIKKGYEPQIRAIVSQIRPDKQILMFSASWPDSVREISIDYFEEFTHIQIESRNQNIEQIIEYCRESEKIKKLTKFLLDIDLNENNKVIIFVDYISKCEELIAELFDYGYTNDVLSLNRKKSQRERDQVVKDFCDGKCLILVASNIAARGLDIPGLKYVINYDCPRNIDTYIHRIGRTGRGNTFGTAYTLFTDMNKNVSNDLVQVLSETNQTIDYKLSEMARDVRRHEIDKKTKLHQFDDRLRDDYDDSKNYFKKIPINQETIKELFSKNYKRSHVRYSQGHHSQRHHSPTYGRYRKYNPDIRLFREDISDFNNGGGHYSRYDRRD